MQDLSPYYDLVEEVISELGVDPSTTRGDRPGNWALKRGSAKVWIDLWHIEKQGQAYFQVMSPVMKLPSVTHQKAFFLELLEINDKLFGVAFTVFRDWAWLKHVREVAGLDKSEIVAMVQRVGTYADKYDDELIGKYNSGSASEATEEATGAPKPPGKA